MIVFFVVLMILYAIHKYQIKNDIDLYMSILDIVDKNVNKVYNSNQN